MPGKGARECGGSIPDVGRFFETAGAGQRPDARRQWPQHDRRVGCEGPDRGGHDAPVVLDRDRARAGTARHAELRGSARSRSRPREGRLLAASPQRYHRLDRVGDGPGHGGCRHRADVQTPVARPWRAHDRQPREPLVERQLQVRVAAPAFRLSIEAWVQFMDQSHLQDGGFQLAARLDVVDGGQFPQQLTHVPARVPAEVRAHPAPQVDCLADVQRSAARVPEHVHAGTTRERCGQTKLGELRVPAHGREGEEVVERGDAHAAGPLEQAVQQLAGRTGVSERSVGRPRRQPEVVSQGGQLAVGHLLPHEPASQRARVDELMSEPRVALGHEGVPQEGQVETHVVADHNGAASDEFEERGQYRLDACGRGHHRFGDPG